MIFGALFCTLVVKFFHSWRTNLVNEYFSWILSDIAVLAGIEIVLAAICSLWRRKSVIRTATVFAALVCAWSVLNAGWLIRTGTQILPSVLQPLLYDPLGTLGLIGGNLVEMPIAAIALLVPGGIAVGFVVFVLAKPLPPSYSFRRIGGKIALSLVLMITVFLGAAIGGDSPLRWTATGQGQSNPSPSLRGPVSSELDYNCQLRAVKSLFSTDSALWDEEELSLSEGRTRREIPTFKQVENALDFGEPSRAAATSLAEDGFGSGRAAGVPPNIVIVVLEGVQYKYTSLADKRAGSTPYLESLAKQGVEFTNARTTVTHTTKAFFGLLTGRFPCVAQDVAEAVPAVKPYASLATILKNKLNYRTACFESATGSFECWPGLMYNLGFDKFWARENLDDPNALVGYFASDEFSMLGPIVEWLHPNNPSEDDRPFLLVLMCSVTHDPYEVPKWFAAPEKEPVKRYRQTVAYTDRFLKELDVALARLNLMDNTIFCVMSDHGEALGEHGLFAHERIAFEEALRVPWVIRAPSLVEPGRKVTEPVSSVDLTPTLLSLLGFRTDTAGFDGVDALGPIPDDRKVYFWCWTRVGPAGFVQGNRKFVFAPATKTVSMYNLAKDPLELVGTLLTGQQAGQIADEIIAWRNGTIFNIPQKWWGRTALFDEWTCSWMGRICSAHYNKPGGIFARFFFRNQPAEASTPSVN